MARLLNVPNLLALTRIVLTPFVMAFVLLSDQIDYAFGIALAIFIPAALTDFADGYLARRWKLTTVLGAFLDSVADKILVVGSLLVLIEVGRAWSWAAFIIICREIAVMGLRAVVALEKSTVPPSFWGKSKTTFQFVAIGFALIRSGSELGPFYFDEWMMLVAVAATVLSGWDYFHRYSGAFNPRDTVPTGSGDE
jgi:CDP-diacylglycerol--glycerol-3-phosphate 3-phosphatidyltransferase